MSGEEHFPQTAGKRPQPDPPTGVGVVCGTITVTPASRWAAFTDDELKAIEELIKSGDTTGRPRGGDFDYMPGSAVIDEFTSEITRREDAATASRLDELAAELERRQS